MIIKQALDAYAASQNKVWQHDRSQTVGASEVGQCLRKTFYSKHEGDAVHGAPRDPEYVDSWGAKARGTVMEDAFWEPALRLQYGDKFLFAGRDQCTLVSGFLSATPDGLVLDDPCFMTECKSIDPRANLSKPKPENEFQTQIQIGMVRELTPYKPTHSILSYMDASFWDQVTEFRIDFNPAVYEVGKLRAAKIMTADNARDLPAEGWIAGGSECEYCPFTRACGIERKSVPAAEIAADPQFAAEIADLARIAKAHEAERDAAEVLMRTAQEEMRNRLRAKGTRKVVGDGVKVIWSAVKGRPSYDNKRLREAAADAGVDVAQYSTVGEPTDRLLITLQPA